MKTLYKMTFKKAVFVALFFIAAGAQAQIDRSKQPEPGPAPKLTLEVPDEFTLPNGLKVLVVENHKLPKVSYSLRIDNNPILDGDKVGISSILANMLGNGTTSIPKDKFNEEIDFLGASVNFGSQSASASSLTRYADRILELMADGAINPLLTEEEFNAEKTKLLEDLKSQEKSVSAVAKRVTSALAYGTNHPYGEFITEASINNITFKDVLAYYEKYFNPNNAYLVVVGDVEVSHIKKLITDHFSKWERYADVSIPLQVPKPNEQYTQINFVDMPNAVQSNIIVTNNVTLKMNDKDYFPVLMANYILGGGGQGYLFLNLREAHGYTYGSYSSISANRYNAARFSASAEVRNSVTDSAIVEILKEIKRIRTEPVDPVTLANAKAKYIGQFVMALERPQTIANFALSIKENKLPKDFYKTYLEKINAVTVEDVMRVANKYFMLDNERIIVVGKGSEVLENLEKTGIPIKYYDKFANPTTKPEAPKMAADVTTATIFNNYLKAIDKEGKLSSATSLLTKYEASAMGATVMAQEKRVPGKLSQSILMNGATLSNIIVTPTEVFMKNGANKQPLPEGMANDMKSFGGLFIEQSLLNSDKAKVAGIETVDGKEAYKVEIPGEVVSISLFYDTKTGLKVKEVQTTSMQGQSQSQASLLKDYQVFEGVLLPTVKESEVMGQAITFNLKEAVFNKDVTAADFE